MHIKHAFIGVYTTAEYLIDAEQCLHSEPRAPRTTAATQTRRRFHDVPCDAGGQLRRRAVENDPSVQHADHPVAIAPGSIERSAGKAKRVLDMRGD